MRFYLLAKKIKRLLLESDSLSSLVDPLFMKVDEFFCLFVIEKEVKWHFGDPDEEFQTFVVNFLTGLGQIGQELFGQHGVASIEFELKKRSYHQSSEIFIVSLMNRFFLILSDPQITLKLIEGKGGIPTDIQDAISAVLVGQAAMIYGQCITEAETADRRDYLTKLWQDIILDIDPNYQEEIPKIVSENSSNFSMLPLDHLLYLHYYLRKQPELTKPLSSSGWALVSHLSGGEIHLDYNVRDRDPVVLAGYLGIIIAFIKSIFETGGPGQITFGTNNINRLFFVNGKDEYFLAIDTPVHSLMQIDEFHDRYFSMSRHVQEDLYSSLHKRLIDEIIGYESEILETQEINDLIKKRYQPRKKGEVRTILSRIFGRF